MKSLSYKRIYKSQEYLATLGTIEYRSLFGSYSLTVDDTVFAMVSDGAVSYTHLDVYKRQDQFGINQFSQRNGHGKR